MPNASEVISDVDSELVQTFHARVLPSLVYVEFECLKTGARSSGTGTVFGYQGNAKDGWLPLIVTAGHVVRSEAQSAARFRVHLYDFSDPSKPTTRTLEFDTSKEGPRDPQGFHYSGPNKELIDIGFLRCPSVCVDGKPFFHMGDDGKPTGGTMSIETDGWYSAEGSRVAWAGFPAIATEIARRPQPCYFEGSVSALVIRDEFQVYLLDGHNTFGVSGGPVWAQKSQHEPSRLIGVISGYYSMPDSPQMPGFVYAATIQSLVGYIEQHWNAKPK